MSAQQYLFKSQYLFDLATEFGEITITPYWIIGLHINGAPAAYYREKVVWLSYDGEPIEEFPLTLEGIQQGIIALKRALQQDYGELREQVTTFRENKYGKRS